MTQLSYPPPPPPPPPPQRGSRKILIIGFGLSLIGSITLFLAGISYLVIGYVYTYNGWIDVTLPGVLGIFFAILILIFACMGYFGKTKKAQQIYGWLVSTIGMIVIILITYAGLFDILPIIGSGLVLFGGILIQPYVPLRRKER